MARDEFVAVQDKDGDVWVNLGDDNWVATLRHDAKAVEAGTPATYTTGPVGLDYLRFVYGHLVILGPVDLDRYEVGDPDPTPRPDAGDGSLHYCEEPVNDGDDELDIRPDLCTWPKEWPHSQHVAGDGTTVVAVSEA